jgi:hypothetical protein
LEVFIKNEIRQLWRPMGGAMRAKMGPMTLPWRPGVPWCTTCSTWLISAPSFYERLRLAIKTYARFYENFGVVESFLLLRERAHYVVLFQPSRGNHCHRRYQHLLGVGRNIFTISVVDNIPS